MQGIKTGEYILYWKTLQCLSTLLVPEAWDEYKQKKAKWHRKKNHTLIFRDFRGQRCSPLLCCQSVRDSMSVREGNNASSVDLDTEAISHHLSPSWCYPLETTMTGMAEGPLLADPRTVIPSVLFPQSELKQAWCLFFAVSAQKSSLWKGVK